MNDDHADFPDHAMKAWMKEFQDMDLDARALVDPARAAGEIGRAMRRVSTPLSFERQPPDFLKRLEQLAPEGAAPEGGAMSPAPLSVPDGAITHLSLTEVAAAIAGGSLSSEDATRACLDRIEALGGALNCIAAIDPDAAIGAAWDADEKTAHGESRGPLEGVPLAHKDMFYRAGRESACGSHIRTGFIPDHTSGALERLDLAGALDIARLNMVEFALGVSGHNEITGPVRNPWNTDYMTGGSSSGSGAAVAAGLVFGALGSDTGGSVRFPASCCGLVGLKPTYGRVSRYGAMALSYSLDTVGPLTRTVADNALMFRTVAGHDPRDAASSRSGVPDVLAALEDGVRGLRLGVAETYFFEPLAGEMRDLMDAAVEMYRRLGAEIVAVPVPSSLTLTNGLTSLILSTEGAALHAPWMRARARDYGRQTLGRLTAGALTPATTYIDAINRRRAILDEFMDAVYASADVLLTPVMMMPVPTIAESDLAANPGFSEFIIAMGHATRPLNYLGLPGLSVPCGFTANGLPAAFQLVGRPFDEATLYRAARAYERETGCTSHRPPV
jgi:aspartyl-tRNA(Asn)/glutamyl-tRNA(Gln) amidotransferase subunit A